MGSISLFLSIVFKSIPCEFALKGLISSDGLFRLFDLIHPSDFDVFDDFLESVSLGGGRGDDKFDDTDPLDEFSFEYDSLILRLNELLFLVS